MRCSRRDSRTPSSARARSRSSWRNRALPASTTRPTNLFSQRLSLASTARGTVAFTGARSSALLGLFYVRVVDAPEAGDLATGRIINNNIQRGADLTLTHRLTPTTSASMTFDLSRIQAVASVGNDRTTEAGARASVRVQLARATFTTFGGSARKLVSNVTPSGKQVSVFVGTRPWVLGRSRTSSPRPSGSPMRIDR